VFDCGSMAFSAAGLKPICGAEHLSC